MTRRAELEFHRELLEGTERLKREIGYNPVRFHQMVDEHGGPEAVRQLLRGRDASDGFTTLWEAGRLEMSAEAVVLLPWYEDLFTATERAVARRRLIEHRFDVDAFLRIRISSPPAWVSGEGMAKAVRKDSRKAAAPAVVNGNPNRECSPPPR